MGAPEGGLKQCAKGRGQDRTSGGGACVSKARFPFVRVGRQAAGWRPFLLKSATVSGGQSNLWSWVLSTHDPSRGTRGLTHPLSVLHSWACLVMGNIKR